MKGLFLTMGLKNALSSMSAEQVHSTIQGTLEIMELLREIPAGRDRAEFVQQMVDREVKKSQAREPESWTEIACKRSCSGCCHMYVQITPSEAELIDSLGVPADETKLARQAQQTDDKRWTRQAGRDFQSMSCVFLDADGSCRIYESRPMNCRKYFVGPTNELCSQPGSAPRVLSVVRAEMIATALATLEFKGHMSLPRALWMLRQSKKDKKS